MGVQEEMERNTTLRPLGLYGKMVEAQLPSQEALLASKHWKAARIEVEKMAADREIKYLAGGRDKVVLDLGNDEVIKLLPTTEHDGIGIEHRFRHAAKAADLEDFVAPVLEEFMIGDIMVQRQPKLRRERIGNIEVRGIRSLLAEHSITWEDGDERNLGRMPDGRLVIIDGAFKYRGLGQRLLEAIGLGHR
jgi:hypothetical protein